MILLAGVLIVLAFFLYSTQSTVVNSIGQEAGREAANPLLADYQAIRSGIAVALNYEIRDQFSIPRCPRDEADYAARVQALLVLMAELESNRGQIFSGSFLDMVPESQNTYDSDAGYEIGTQVRLYITNGRATMTDTVTYVTGCFPVS